MRSILAEETLRVATAFVSPGERPAVWLTTSEDWEETCNKMVQNKETGEIVPLDRDQTASLGEGLFRVDLSGYASLHRSTPRVRERLGLRQVLNCSDE